MLGRLEMAVDACIAAYIDLTKVAFKEKENSSRLSFSWSRKVNTLFKSGKLKRAVEDVVSSNGASPIEAFNDGKDRGCRT